MLRVLVVLVVPVLLGAGPAVKLDDLGPFADFALTDRGGETITPAKLRGKVWVASFVFIRCAAGCNRITTNVAQLHERFRDAPDVRFVTFTVDPTHDREEQLAEYARAFNADPQRWFFLTGPEAEIFALHKRMLHSDVTPREKPGDRMHSTKLLLIDADGHVRAEPGRIAFDGIADKEEYEREELALLERSIQSLRGQASPVGWDFPLFHAVLNSVATLLLVVGWLAIKLRAVRLHVVCLATTLAISAVFLGSYLYYHLVIKGSVATRFVDQNPAAPAWAAYLYYAVLGSHTILAVVVTPFAVWAAYLGWQRLYDRHTRLTKWVMPVWLYVTTTGVLVYLMLYRLYA